jgi:predicted metal-dependent enzyme (double-stranded beta helix superfamily)
MAHVRGRKELLPHDTNDSVDDELATVQLPHFSDELAVRTSELLDEPGVLSVAALERLVEQIAARPDLWRPLVVVDRERRRYELLYEDHRVDIWVLSWMPGQRTGFHDHDRSGVGLVCVQGELIEGSLVIGANVESTRMTAGTVRGGPGGYIHAVAHQAGEPAVSIHAYSIPLARFGQYRVDPHGRLYREPEHGRKELQDATIDASVVHTTR